ncbi:zinc metallochaperone AztD [Sinomonas sp. JGH33]|uniref:Zinc metallochaperone AztD n=1 Tax=Sinomonas terricola TaxID=3110330 RepID=A0ABU5T2T1_9MICC|nr:zinc metallochaperone AztD [Sinomonas sp. JGH33]MEA5453955.1 zinc metallochaperone AztD [Sinomonas sp. JGH33]
MAVAYKNGIAVLDGKTLKVVETFSTEDFTRVNGVGDGRNVLVTTSKGFQVLDTAKPALTDTVFKATSPGHVVRHADRTILFDDGTGTTTIFGTDALLKSGGALPETETYKAAAPHHGVSIQLKDSTLLTTVGDKTGRTGAAALRPNGEKWDKVSENSQCRGIHGEGAAADEAVVFGCEDGALLYHRGTFEKFTAPDKFGRMGNAYTSETSPIIVGDYKSNPDAEGYLLNAVTLIDTAKHAYRVVNLPSDVRYTWRDIARGSDGLAYILSTDGSIHVLDPSSGEIVKRYPVISPWEGPSHWQDPHPAIAVKGTTGYITEPATSTVHAIDLTTGADLGSVKLSAAPNEITVAQH